MATLLAHVTWRPRAEAEPEPVAATLYGATHTTEAGVRHFRCCSAVPNHGRVHASCRSTTSGFVAHQTSDQDHEEERRPLLGGLIESLPPQWVDPVPGASALSPTGMQDAPPGADDSTLAYTDRFAAVLRRVVDDDRPAESAAGRPRLPSRSCSAPADFPESHVELIVAGVIPSL